MRQEIISTDLDGELSGYTFRFQIANKGMRRACSLNIQAGSAGEAQAIFRNNWPAIESMARDGTEAGTINSAAVTLAMS